MRSLQSIFITLCIYFSDSFSHTTNNPSHPVTTTNWDENPILLAVYHNDMHAVQQLIESGSNPNIKDSINGWTPLHLAANNGNVEMVEYLLNHGVKLDEYDATGWTPLMTACYSKSTAVVKLLLQKYQMRSISYSQQGIITSLVPAYLSDSEEIKQIISKSIQKSTLGPLFTTKEKTISVLLTAAHSGSSQALQTILPLRNYEVNERSLGDLTPLMLAASAGRSDNVELLLSYNADMNLQDHRGWTALMFAVQSNCLKCIELLLSSSSPSSSSGTSHNRPTNKGHESEEGKGCEVELTNDSGHTASDIAERRGFPELGQEIFAIGYCNAMKRFDIPTIVAITRVGGNPNIQCRTMNGYTPLILVTRLGDEDSLRFLLESFADPNLSESNHWTPLMFAILRNSSHIVETLLDYGATVNSYRSSSSSLSSSSSSSSSYSSSSSKSDISPLNLIKMLHEEEEREGRVLINPEINDMIRFVSRCEVEQMMLIGTELKKWRETRLLKLTNEDKKLESQLPPLTSSAIPAPGMTPSSSSPSPPSPSSGLRSVKIPNDSSTPLSSSSSSSSSSKMEDSSFSLLSSFLTSLWEWFSLSPSS